MKSKLILVFLVASSAALAQQPGDKPSFHASETAIVEAVVEAINHETREVTVRRQDGSTLTFIASEEARNLGQVVVGDVLRAEYRHAVDITVVDADEFEPAEGEIAAMARTEEGDMPGMAAFDTQVTVAKVMAIDLENNTYKLEFPDGSVNEYVARNPEYLKMAAVGDAVIIEVTDAVAIMVEEVGER